MTKEEVFTKVSLWLNRRNPPKVEVHFGVDSTRFMHDDNKVIVPNRRISSIFLGNEYLIIKFARDWALFVSNTNGSLQVEPIS